MQSISDRIGRLASRIVSWVKGIAWYDLVLLVGLVVVGFSRFRILSTGGAPPTIDSGNWLAFADGIFGEGVRSSTIVYPPLVPLLARGFVGVFGTIDGIALLAALSSLVPAIGMYVGLRWLGLGTGALVASLLMLGPSAIGEATAWGGFPQLIGLGLTPIVLIAADRWLRTWSWIAALVAGLLLTVLLATSHFVGATVVLAIAVMAVMALLSPVGAAQTWWRELLTLGLVLLPTIWLAPVYLSLVQTMGGASSQFQSFDQLTWSNLFEHIEFLYRDSPWIWRMVLSGMVVTPFLLWRQYRTTLWRVTVGLLVAALLATVFTREGRFLYFLTILGSFSVALWARQIPDLDPRGDEDSAAGSVPSRIGAFVVVGLIAVFGWQLGSGLSFFEIQRDYYGILNPGLVDGIEYVRDNAEPGDVIAVTSLTDAPLGWWVEAITQGEVLYGSPLRWLAFDDEIERAAVANSIFAPPFPTDEKLALAADAGVDFIIVPTRWAFYDSEAFEAMSREEPSRVVFMNDGAVVLVPGTVE